MRPLVSFVTPTMNRPETHKSLYEGFLQDHWAQKELVVLDESARPSGFFTKLRDKRVRYYHKPGKPRLGGVTRIGAARNQLTQLAKGSVLLHRDDDDWYAPEYATTMLDRLGGAALAKLDVWRCYHEATGVVFEWDTRDISGHAFALQGALAEVVDMNPSELGPDLGSNLLDAFRIGFGWSYVYPRAVAIAYPFQEEGTEDIPWAQGLRAAGGEIVYVSDRPDLAMHTVHVDPLHPLGGSAHYPQKLLGAAGEPGLRREVARRMIGAVGAMQELEQGKAIRLEPGRKYSILASVRDKHSLRALAVRVQAWGANVEEARDNVPPEEFGVEPPADGHRLVHVIGAATKEVTMPWSVPSFMQALGEKSTVVRAWVGAGVASTAGATLVDMGRAAAKEIVGLISEGFTPLDPSRGDIAILPGRTYVGDALVKDDHLASLRDFTGMYGLALEDETRSASGRAGYTFVSFTATASADAQGMLPWAVPAPLSWIDDTHVVTCSVSKPVGAGRAETFHGIPAGYEIHKITSFLKEIPPNVPTVQSRETGRIAVLGHGAAPRVRVGAGDTASSLLATPQAQAAWATVQKQLTSEGTLPGSLDAIAAQGTFSDALTSLATQGLQAGISDTEIVASAQQYVLMGSTIFGAVQNIAGMISSAGSIPPAQLMTAVTGTLIGATAAIAGATGIGAAVVGAVAGAIKLLEAAGFFGSPPQGTEVCPGYYCNGAAATVTTQGPSGPLGCACIFQAQDSPLRPPPGSAQWRSFPVQSTGGTGGPDDMWFVPNGGASMGLWRGALFGTQVAGSLFPAVRPIDAAFPQYHMLECNVAQSSGQGWNLTAPPPSDFLAAFFSAWKMNAAYCLNGLKPQDDAQVLLHTLRLWNKAHPNTTTTTIVPATAPLTYYADPCTSTQPLYVSLLASAAASLASGDSRVVDPNGNLIVNTGTRAALPHLVIAPLLSASIAGKSSGLSLPGKALAGVGVAGATVVGGAVGVSLLQNLAWDFYLDAGWELLKAGVGAGEPRRRKRR